VDVWVEISEKIRKLHFLSQATLANVRRLNLLFRNGYFWFFSHAIPFPQRKFFPSKLPKAGLPARREMKTGFRSLVRQAFFVAKVL
jgi:hypothetical protein